MSILKILAAQLEAMTQADRQIGQFIIDNPERMLGLSSAELAKATGRSQSSVVKFSQKLGYGGYQQLKLAVSKAKAQEWQAPAGIIHGTIDASDSYMTIMQKLIGSKLLSMRETSAANGEQTIDQALDILVQARRIQLAGVGASSLVARDFSYKLLKLGRTVLLDSDNHIQIANVSTLNTSDLLVALSYSGTSMEIVKIAELAKARGATVISITGLQPNPLLDIADINLYTVADEERVRSSAITSRDAQLMLIDLLFILLLRRQEDSHDYIHRSEAAVTVLKA
ncbi:MurR/RpiR family transcriptional regulator [Devosia sp. J2-20]|mgnify:CR=1 FL=1|jgi:DNA-binding MurR/RpiR family transcriptional regulator|uniref:MurR/RpiR family transcriptional regulator n=1 Tax=Devosia TaxID=46913 RepID=UPI0022AE6A30|nr:MULTISPECIES: MurR/RpiR family transcriptional regulator [Devosia]MCZ4345620.1 MurR/RpiR family transcriptional regulator [Devosia neptuniae]WDQ99232.1 MurR/RpiR family transcriptional regulator [Devosia sp. J2-20]|tara:strand:- start:16528 stop:17376 length:849 start_codon:yes stop_codon:yes gene_type:complete